MIFSLANCSWCIQHNHLVRKLRPLFTNPWLCVLLLILGHSPYIISLYIDERFVVTRGADFVDDMKVHKEARKLV